MKSFWGNENRYLRIRYNRINISQKMALIFLSGFLFFIVMVFTISDVGFINIWKAQQKLNKMKNEIGRLEEENKLLENSIENIKNDPFALEKIAREKYGYINPGDKVFRIKVISDKKNDTSLPSFLDIHDDKQ
ncbi:MAG: septum formation initiator family protein [Deltaproteobacteria bacterium]|nr:septum formation initiator family protein [Deltaproteobacteria bacterium]